MVVFAVLHPDVHDKLPVVPVAGDKFASFILLAGNPYAVDEAFWGDSTCAHECVHGAPVGIVEPVI